MFRDRLSKYVPMVKADVFHLASVSSPVNHSDADVRFVGFVAMDKELAIADYCWENIGSFDVANVLREAIKILQR